MSTLGLMDVAIKANGLKIIWKVLVATSGLKAVPSMVNSIMIRSMDMEYTTGQMADVIRAIGKKASSMDLAFIWNPINKKKMVLTVYGRMENESKPSMQKPSLRSTMTDLTIRNYTPPIMMKLESRGRNKHSINLLFFKVV